MSEQPGLPMETLPQIEPEVERASKANDLRILLAFGFGCRHEHPLGSPRRKRTHAIVRGVIRDLRALADEQLEGSRMAPAHDAAFVGGNTDGSFNLFRQGMSVRFALSVLKDVSRTLQSANLVPAGVGRSVDAARSAVARAAQVFYAAAAGGQERSSAENGTRIRLFVDKDIDRPGIRLIFYQDNCMIGQLTLPLTASQSQVDSIVDGFLDAWS